MPCLNCPHIPEMCKPISGWKIFEFEDSDGKRQGYMYMVCPCCVITVKRKITQLEKSLS